MRGQRTAEGRLQEVTEEDERSSLRRSTGIQKCGEKANRRRQVVVPTRAAEEGERRKKRSSAFTTTSDECWAKTNSEPASLLRLRTGSASAVGGQSLSALSATVLERSGPEVTQHKLQQQYYTLLHELQTLIQKLKDLEVSSAPPEIPSIDPSRIPTTAFCAKCSLALNLTADRSSNWRGTSYSRLSASSASTSTLAKQNGTAKKERRSFGKARASPAAEEAKVVLSCASSHPDAHLRLQADLVGQEIVDSSGASVFLGRYTGVPQPYDDDSACEPADCSSTSPVEPVAKNNADVVVASDASTSPTSAFSKAVRPCCTSEEDEPGCSSSWSSDSEVDGGEDSSKEGIGFGSLVRQSTRPAIVPSLSSSMKRVGTGTWMSGSREATEYPTFA